MKFKEGYKVRSMAGENVVIMQGTAGSDMTRIISLNDSSLLLWNKLQGKEFEVADVAGNPKVLQFLVGQVMKLSKGKANPKLVSDILNSKLQ